MNRNFVEFVGNLCKDPKVKYLPSGKPLTELEIAVSRDYKKKGSDEWTKQPALYLSVKLWDDHGSRLAGVMKGRKVHVTGKMDVENWTDKESGKPRSKMVMTAYELDIADHKGKFPIGGPVPHTAETRQDDNDAFDQANAEAGWSDPDAIPF